MGHWKKLLMIFTGSILLTGLVILAAGLAITHFLVELWWFDSLEYGAYHWMRILYRWFLSGGVTLLFFTVLLGNFWLASRVLAGHETTFRGEMQQRQLRNLARFQLTSIRIYIPLSLVLSILIALPFYHQWEDSLLFIFGQKAEVSEPLFNTDISFYLFAYAIFELIQSELLICSGVMTVLVALTYWIEHSINHSGKRSWPLGARIHMTILILLFAAVGGWDFMLDRYGLVYSEAHDPLFFGPGFVEMNYHLPLIWVGLAALGYAVISLLLFLRNHRGLKNLMLGLTIIAVSVMMRNIPLLPDLMERFIVKPNPVRAEQRFMAANIEATLAAYALDNIQTVGVTATLDSKSALDSHVREHLHNIPIWDPEYLDDVYQELQGIRPYYHFAEVDTSRYTVNGTIEQVNLSAREVNLDLLPSEARDWENRHLRYTHGYGSVVTPASQNADTPMRWFLRDLNLQSSIGLNVEKPDIYYGLENLDYALVPNRLEIPDISSFDQDSNRNYSGEGGVPVDSLFSRVLLSSYFRDERLFFSTNIDTHTRALFHRNIIERVKTLAPFLALDHDPYLVVTPSRHYWILDAYTTSNWYPVSKTTRFRFRGDEEERSFNYIRNSVKVVVDAFDGDVDFYIADENDPLIRAYDRAYPGLFKDMRYMPPLLKDQIRYPRDLFEIQLQQYARYHQTDPALFYQQAETWDFPKVHESPVAPYYFTTYLEGCEAQQNFVIIKPITPVGRANLSALALGGDVKFSACGGNSSKKILLYEFNKDVQVDGPAQVSAKIDQDSSISQQFSLWDQKGSHVKRGRILIVPIGRSLLYVQPVYIVSTGLTRIPELTRVILSMGDVIVMETSLDKALDVLEARLQDLQKMRGLPGSTPPAGQPIMEPS
ncbi:MAG: hypothetical protein RIQ52_1797 [Pseudomonadota bacterium]|jgi:uncharacterized membrane protein (UPF0182 family)